MFLATLIKNTLIKIFLNHKRRIRFTHMSVRYLDLYLVVTMFLIFFALSIVTCLLCSMSVERECAVRGCNKMMPAVQSGPVS